MLDLEVGSSRILARIGAAVMAAAVSPSVTVAANGATLLGVNGAVVLEAIGSNTQASPQLQAPLSPALIERYGHSLGSEGTVTLIMPGPDGKFTLLRIEKRANRAEVYALPLDEDQSSEYVQRIIGIRELD